ncbi:hypothetical protein [Seonamhaeicola marinus]|uniref:Uncharacterized protein n=1 Tax=Seonamhaeicola marinus TaxID=1912246 RepID=A0A5D0J735_9FLAO|nr:hypothetical protein [Seonamhaeicola marinus]TYA92175.1 hypothetical protein FUA24_01720 [Seonamhaeicola marinus]
MKKITLLLLIFLVLSCNKKVIELPEINHSDIAEIQDVSAAYLFYNETQPDSVELNRKNLISTTNWLVNVDKRLTLKQAIPHIKFLQEKKANGAHKNENAKNYFTCHDTSRNNLGFLEFTNLEYTEGGIFSNYENYSKVSDLRSLKNQISINFNSSNIARILNMESDSASQKIVKSELINRLKQIDSSKNRIYLVFNSSLLFQDYISFKELISKADIKNAKISNKESIYN